MGQLQHRAGEATRDIAHLLDAGGWSALQRRVVLLAAIAIIFDGFDGQLIGYAIPVLIAEWGVARGAFAPVIAAGLLGMGVGSAIAGMLGDRLGRRRAMIGSVALFALATASIGLARGLVDLGVLRFVAGMGIGGALPISTTISAEFAPRRAWTMAVSATIVCVPLGGMLAGLFAGAILPTFGWRAMFLIGGVLPLLLVAFLVALLPETPRWLARHPARWPELAGLLTRMGLPVGSDTRFADHRVAGPPARLATLFRDGRGATTLLLWIAFFLCLMAVYTAFSWLPTMLSAEGLDVATASKGLAGYNLGGVIGALACAATISRFGSRWPLILCCIGGAVTAWLLRSVDPVAQTGLLLAGLALHGLFVNAVQVILFGLAAHAYPTEVRATGTATALVFGRLGALTSAFAGAAVIGGQGPGMLLAFLAATMIGTMIALAALRQHISATRAA